MKKILLTSFVLLMFGLTACSTSQPTEEVLNTPTSTTPPEIEAKPVYEESDNSLDALISRANITPSGYLISHYGDSQCHIILGTKTSDIPVTLKEDQITLERLIDCTIESDNMCAECGKLYSAEDFEFPTKAELIQAQIEANQPPEEKPVFGVVTGYIPYAVDGAYFYELNLNEVSLEENIIHAENYDLEIYMVTEGINGELSGYLPNETNFGELHTDEVYKFVSQYSNEELTDLSAIYVIRDTDAGSIIHKFTNMKTELSEELAVAEIIKYADAINENGITLDEFYRNVATKNTEEFIIEDTFNIIKLNSTFIPDYNKQLVDVECNLAYIDTAEDSNKVVIISNYTAEDLANTELFTKIDLSESEETTEDQITENSYSIYESNGFYYFSSETINPESSVNTVFGFSGFETAEEALAFYKEIVQ